MFGFILRNLTYCIDLPENKSKQMFIHYIMKIDAFTYVFVLLNQYALEATIVCTILQKTFIHIFVEVILQSYYTIYTIVPYHTSQFSSN